MWVSEPSPVWCQNWYFPPLDLIRFDYPIIPKSFHSVSVPIKPITKLTHNAIFTAVSWYRCVRARPAMPQTHPRPCHPSTKQQHPPASVHWVSGDRPVRSSVCGGRQGHSVADMNCRISDVEWHVIRVLENELLWLKIHLFFFYFLNKCLLRKMQFACLASSWPWMCDLVISSFNIVLKMVSWVHSVSQYLSLLLGDKVSCGPDWLPTTCAV